MKQSVKVSYKDCINFMADQKWSRYMTGGEGGADGVALTAHLFKVSEKKVMRDIRLEFERIKWDYYARSARDLEKMLLEGEAGL